MPADYTSHTRTCPDRSVHELQKFRFNDPIPGQHGMLALPRTFGSSLIPSESDEDDAPKAEAIAGKKLNMRYLIDLKADEIEEDEETPEDREVADLMTVKRRPQSAKPLRRPTHPLGYFLASGSESDGSEIYPERRQSSPVPERRAIKTSSVKMESQVLGQGAPSMSDISVSEVEGPTFMGLGRGRRPWMNEPNDMQKLIGGMARSNISLGPGTGI